MVVSAFVAALLSVFLVSLIALVGIFALSFRAKFLQKVLLYLVSFSAGALLGDTFFHLLPEVAKAGFTLSVSLYILLGIGVFFVLEKFIHWDHCHRHVTESDHSHPFAVMNVVGDGVHNFIDGIIIASAYIISFPAGIATTIAVALHEIPQEIGDFAVMIQGGFSKGKALFLNFAAALMAVLGALLTFGLAGAVNNIETGLVSFAAGSFIYIALSDLFPELHKETRLSRSLLQLLALLAGVGVMAALLFLE